LIFDLVLHRQAHAIKLKEALMWSGVWIVLAAAFGFFVYIWRGHESGISFFSAYLVEESLSVDNLFVFLMLFTFFCVPQAYQHRILFWGILGAIILRAAFIFGGLALIQNLEWVIYVFGAFLIYTGVQLGIKKEENPHPEANPVVKLICRFLPVSKNYTGPSFFTRENGRLLATPLLLVLIVVDLTDIIFAVDSIPAVLSITTDSL